MHVRISVESIDDGFDVGLRGILGQVFVKGAHADLGALLNLHGDVASARHVVAHEDGSEPGRASGRVKRERTIGEFHLDARGDGFAVE